ncbi:MAG TPA: HPP family protein [Bosea sp. (in: a-proteobacteria)]|uniref:HPP family protein n=1 Tax=Bosea sp. (in: a-proteobacteria) TaxID=1871050 RepID=UPI002E0E1A33|nr:HPP family protein [Bosea sp. (in: a-proteobacteria)]
MKLFHPILAGATLAERTAACAGVFTAIALTAAAGFMFPIHAPLVVAPIGASAVLVFVVPASPLAQPWPVIGGNVISAFVGLAVGWAVPELTIAAALAVALAIAVMSLTRSLHPPGGAVALTAVLGGPAVMKWGLLFPFVPIGLCSLSLVALGAAFHGVTRRSYPHRPPSADPVLPLAVPTAAFSSSDIDEALAQMGDSFDIAREDLDLLLQYAEASAMRRQALSS